MFDHSHDHFLQFSGEKFFNVSLSNFRQTLRTYAEKMVHTDSLHGAYCYFPK